MNRIALNIICKDEAHVIRELLASVRSVVDIIVAVDTGSSDDTVRLIEAFGRQAGIPTFVSSRPFDDFASSRNHALDRLLAAVEELGWDRAGTWGLTIDCDELLTVDPSFNKKELSRDLYNVVVRTGTECNVKGSLFKLSAGLRWVRPVHETLDWYKPGVVIGEMPYLSVERRNIGGSWKGNLEAKFARYARLLEEYVAQGNKDFLTLLNTGESFLAASAHAGTKQRKGQYAKQAITYFELALEDGNLSATRSVMVLSKLAMTKELLGEDWPGAHALLLKAYALDPTEGEPISTIAEHYYQEGRYATACIYTHFAMKCLDGQDIMAQGKPNADPALYAWRLLLQHYKVSYMLGNREETAKAWAELNRRMAAKPDLFTTQERMGIASQSPGYLKIRRWMRSFSR